MTAETDPLASELQRFEADLDAATTELDEAKRASRGMRAERRRGRPYRELRERTRPVEAVRSAIGRLRPATARLRRAEMEALRAEGASTTEIGRTFGVTHQRVSRILSEPPAS